jgi:mono/diheme cytochrome c family protein
MMGRLALALAGSLLVGAAAAAQSIARSGYDAEYLGAPLADPVLQHAKETYVVFGCAYCHGLNLVPRGEAADLRSSAIVGRDENANLIGPVLRAGIPRTSKLSPMPQFSDLSEQQIGAIARWIHYARQRARYEQLTSAPLPPGDAAAGRGQFDRVCADCHSTRRDLTGIGSRYAADALRAQILEPNSLRTDSSFRIDRLQDARTNAGRDRHGVLLENYSAAEVANLVAYLQGHR